jgi:hypothetical protein
LAVHLQVIFLYPATTNSAPAKPIIKEGGVTKTATTVNKGTSFTFTCNKGSGGSTPDSWKFYKDNITVTTTGVTGSTLTKTAAENDAGLYKCKALQGGLASAFSDALTLTVHGWYLNVFL